MTSKKLTSLSTAVHIFQPKQAKAKQVCKNELEERENNNSAGKKKYKKHFE